MDRERALRLLAELQRLQHEHREFVAQLGALYDGWSAQLIPEQPAAARLSLQPSASV